MPMLLNLGYVHKLELFSIHDSRSDQCKHISTLTISVKKRLVLAGILPNFSKGCPKIALATFCHQL